MKQLFIDDHVIESLDGVSKKLNQPTKYAANPVLGMIPKGQPTRTPIKTRLQQIDGGPPCHLTAATLSTSPPWPGSA